MLLPTHSGINILKKVCSRENSIKKMKSVKYNILFSFPEAGSRFKVQSSRFKVRGLYAAGIQ